MIPVIAEIAEKRKSLGMSQAELSKRVGITQPHLSNIEKGKKIPQIDTFVEIVKNLNLEMMLIPAEKSLLVKSVVRDRAGTTKSMAEMVLEENEEDDNE